jgi:quinoprotein glucose dehydrogenase
VEDLIDFTPELRSEALQIASKLVLGPIFTPLIVKGDGGKLGILAVPGAGGGPVFPAHPSIRTPAFSTSNP